MDFHALFGYIKHGDRTIINVKAFYDQMIDRFMPLSPAQHTPWLMPSICVVNFLIFANSWSRDGGGGFFDLVIG